jgi:hypothetical protein
MRGDADFSCVARDARLDAIALHNPSIGSPAQPAADSQSMRVAAKLFTAVLAHGNVLVAHAQDAAGSAIVLIDAANQRRAQGMSVLHAAVYAARRRVVPMRITSFTTIAGLFSLAFGLGGKSLVWGRWPRRSSGGSGFRPCSRDLSCRCSTGHSCRGTLGFKTASQDLDKPYNPC